MRKLNYEIETQLLVENSTNTDAVLNALYPELNFISTDQDELWAKRGLSVQVCTLAGFKTNDRSNREILLSLAASFSQETLIESGLWIRGAGGEAKPNSQFYGYGLVSRNGGPDDSGVWGWKHDGRCNPVLIPYFNAQGRLFQIRPHKGGIAGKPPHLYVARSQGGCDTACAMAVVTEGEFKAWALHAVLNSSDSEKIGVAAFPGISMARNPGCMDELFAWLKAIKPAKIVIAYDSEEKGDSRLPAFKPNPRKRHEAQIWARYLAKCLDHEGFDAAVGFLPKEWRDPKTGKADWDGRLAARICDFSK